MLSAFSNLKKKEPTFSPGQLTPISTAPQNPRPVQEESALSAFASRAAQRPASHPAPAVASSGAQPSSQRPAPSAGDSPLSLFNASNMKSRPVSTARPEPRIVADGPAQGARSARDFAPREFREESPQRRARILTDDDVQLTGGLDMIYSDRKQKEQIVVAQRRQQNQVRVTPLISHQEREASRPKPAPATEEARLAQERELARKRVLEEWKKRASMMR